MASHIQKLGPQQLPTITDFHFVLPYIFVWLLFWLSVSSVIMAP
jgi:hypothetical protein